MTHNFTDMNVWLEAKIAHLRDTHIPKERYDLWVEIRMQEIEAYWDALSGRMAEAVQGKSEKEIILILNGYIREFINEVDRITADGKARKYIL